MHGLKQHIRVERSFCDRASPSVSRRVHVNVDSEKTTRIVSLTRRAFFACSTASQGAGRSRKTAYTATGRPKTEESLP